MSWTCTPDDRVERAALYALGALAGEEARLFEAHLAGGCVACGAEVTSLTAVAAEIGCTAAAAPPAELRRRVVARVATDAAAGAAVAVIDAPGLRFVQAPHLRWDVVSEVMERKMLFHDPVRGRDTQLMRLRPGAAFPSHRHADVEELYVLEGDLTVNGVEMHAGGYCRAEPGSVHTGISTRQGCVFIVTSSPHDEFLVAGC